MISKRKYRKAYVISDVITLLVGTIGFNVIRFKTESTPTHFGSLSAYLFDTKMFGVYGLLLIFWLSIFTLSGYYNNPVAKSRIEEFFVTLMSVFVGSIAEFFLLVSNDKVDHPNSYMRLFMVLFGIMFLLVYLGRLFITLYGKREIAHPSNWPKALVIGCGREMKLLIDSADYMHFKPVGEVRLPVDHSDDASWNDLMIRQVEAAVIASDPDHIYIANDQANVTLTSKVLFQLYRYGCVVKVSKNSLPVGGARVKYPMRFGVPMVDMSNAKMSDFECSMKWLIDRVVSLLVLVLLLPVYLLIAFLVKRSSPGPIFYRQERIGLRGKSFYIYKFRTMYVDAESMGPQLSSDDDPRITPVGRKLRKFRLDELPQFWNVLKGDMSIVGPRPERQFYIEQIINRAPHYYLMHNVLPGITSWGMVKYGYASSVDEMLERLEYDSFYYENMSLRFDMLVLFYTVQTILKGSGK